MNESFLTPSIRRLLFQIQVFLALTGLILLLFGGIGVAMQFVPRVKSLAADSLPFLNAPETAVISGLMALAGYAVIYTFLIIAAREPYSIRALRNGLLVIALVFVALVIWGGLIGGMYFAITLLIALAGIGAAFWLWQQVQTQNLWQVFGQAINRRRRSRRIFYVTGALGLIILAVLGVIYGILSDTLELPLSQPEPGELLYSTTFDNFNDEWDLFDGSQKSQIIDGELVLNEFSGVPERGAFSLLKDRKFSDFDLRVRTRQIAGSDDNTIGVLFRVRDTENYYLFEISGDGYYRLTKVEENSAENITPWTPATFIHLGEAENEVRIVAKNDQFTFFVNQQPIRLCTRGENLQPVYNRITEDCQSNEWQMVYEDGTFKQGRIGVAAGTTRTTDLSQPVIIGFDNLMLVGPQ